MKTNIICVCLFLVASCICAQSTDPWKLVNAHLDNQAKLSGYFIIGSKGKIVLQRGVGMANRKDHLAFSEKTLYSIGSITKSFTATAILLLEKEGKLKVTDPITQYFTNVPADKRAITIHQLLTHSAGFGGAIGDDYEAISGDEFAGQAFRSPLHFAPGTDYMYSNVGYSLLGLIIEKVSGNTYSAFLEKHIFSKAGMKTAGYTNPNADYDQLAHGYTPEGDDWGTAKDKPWNGSEPHWHLKANGGLLVSGHDMYQWYLALRNHIILDAATLARQIYPHVKEGQDDSYYGYGYVVSPDGDVIQHNGGNRIFKADFRWFPKEDMFIFSVTNDANVRLFRLNDEIIDIIHSGQLPAQESWKVVPAASFPADPSQATVSAFIALLRDYTVSRGDAFITGHVTEAMVERNGNARLQEVFSMLSRDAGEGTIQKVETADNVIRITLPAAEPGAVLKLSITMTDDKIDRLSAEIEGM